MSDYDVPAFIKYGPNYEPSPQDVLRKAYMRNVVAPLAHVVFAAAVDAGGSGFYETLHEQEGEHIRQVATIEGASEHPVPLILGMSVDKSFQTYAERRMPDVVGVLTDPQRVALHRFFTGGSARDPNKSLLAEASTIMNATGNIVFRHPELGYNGDVTKLVGFWRHKRTPHVLRGFATGGIGFADGLRAVNGHEVLAAWQDPHAPVLDTANPDHLKVDPHVAAAGPRHRTYNEQLDTIYPEGGVTRMAMIYSVGCPARFLGLDSRPPELVKEGLAFSRQQLEQLNEIGNGTLEQSTVVPRLYMVRRDSYAGMCGVLATGVSIVAGLKQ